MSDDSRIKRSGNADTQPYTLRLPKALHRNLRVFSLHKGQSLNDLIVETLERFWNEQPEARAYSKVFTAGETPKRAPASSQKAATDVAPRRRRVITEEPIDDD